MAARFASPHQHELFDAIRSRLRQIGYTDELLAENYTFSDWFRAGAIERTASLAAFGQTPHSTDTACFAVLLERDRHGVDLIQDHRALGAPLAFGVGEKTAACWRVGRDAEATRTIVQFSIDEIEEIFQEFADQWRPESVLRAKNIASRPPLRQRRLLDFDYSLLPALEGEIRTKLDPMVQDACTAAKTAYKETSDARLNERELFRLAFWLLAGKVFRDRGFRKFANLPSTATADEVLTEVAAHYNRPLPRLLNRPAREAVHEQLWTQFDFRNLSIDVLTYIWANTFVSRDIRKRLGIHPTPRVVAKCIVDSLPFEDIAPDDRYVLEPCCGSATFLVAALQRLRDMPGQTRDARERHKYFVKHLVGYERESFGVEISQLCLTLADFPNPNGWQLHERDVFDSHDFLTELARTRIVVCNPPFEDIEKSIRSKYEVDSVKKPVALLNLVLANLHPEGMLGFVLPRAVIDGQGYKSVRERLANRFSSLEVIELPDKAFDTSEHETALLIAHKPRAAASAGPLTLRYSEVSKADWPAFKAYCGTSRDEKNSITVEDASNRLAIPQLQAVWAQTKHNKTLGDIASFHRGLEWTLPLTKGHKETGNRELLVRDKMEPGCRRGVPPKARFSSFETPLTKYLRMLPEDERANSYNKPWHAPKVILSKARRSRGHWRMAAVADMSGLVFYQTFVGVWPHDPSLVTAIAAVLNGPLANAFISTRESRDITSETLADIPMPEVSRLHIAQINDLVEEYRRIIAHEDGSVLDLQQSAEQRLKRIDAAVLTAYDLAPKVERELLDYFNGEERIVPFRSTDYFPSDFLPCFPLSEYMSAEFQNSTVEAWRRRHERSSDGVVARWREIGRALKE